MEIIYLALERVLLAGAPVMKRIGFDRLERPVASIERAVKGALFDCRMCGQCILSAWEGVGTDARRRTHPACANAD